MRRTGLAILALIVVLAAAWTGLWTYSRLRLAAEIDPALARLAAERGVILACADRSFGGFPFRLTVTCAAPRADLAGGGTVAMTAASASVSIFSHDHADIALTGPLTARFTSGAELSGSFSALTVGLVVRDEAIGTGQIRASDVALTLHQPSGLPDLALTAATLQADAGPNPFAATDADLVASATAAGASIGGSGLAPGPVDIALDLTVVQAVAAASGADAWREAGGRLSVNGASLDLGGSRISATGALALSPADRPDGRLTLSTASLAGAQKMAPAVAGLAAAFLIIGRPGDGGQRTIELKIDDGDMRVGPLRLGRLPALR